MALTYEESADLRNDLKFKGRITTACLNFAKYIQGEPAITPAHNTRFRWAQQTYSNPDMSAQQVQPAVVMDDNVQSQGAEIPDDQLQTAVETVVQQMI